MKKEKIGKIFRIASILFIVGCFIFYGSRLFKYYKIFNPKNVSSNNLLSIEIPKNSVLTTTGNGLYRIGGSYIYRGEVNNNYLKYSGMLFRILKINYGGTTEIVANSSINSLAWNQNITTYDQSDINKYLNTYFLNLINQKYLVKTRICLDNISAINDLTTKCKNYYDKSYIKLLDLNSFVNSLQETSYITEENSSLWLSNNNNDLVWHTNGYNISTSNSSNYYNIKPVLTLKYNVKIVDGNGTINDPYTIEKEKNFKVGDYIQLDKDLWQIIDSNNNKLKLSYTGLLDNLIAYGKNDFNPDDQQSIAYYLNNEYLNSLKYKAEILESTFKIGNYSNTLSSLDTKEVKAKIGLLNISDIKLQPDDRAYFLINKDENELIYTFSNTLEKEENNIAKNIKPVIYINKTTISGGIGTKESPYTIEVK